MAMAPRNSRGLGGYCADVAEPRGSPRSASTPYVGIVAALASRLRTAWSIFVGSRITEIGGVRQQQKVRWPNG